MRKAIDDAIQIHGGVGVSEEYPLAKLSRDARAYEIFEGTTEINKLIIARSVLE